MSKRPKLTSITLTGVEWEVRLFDKFSETFSVRFSSGYFCCSILVTLAEVFKKYPLGISHLMDYQAKKIILKIAKEKAVKQNSYEDE